MNERITLCAWDDLQDRQPFGVVADEIDLVVVRYDDTVSVLEGRCPHRGALLADGHIDGANIICGVHNWDFRFDTGVSEYNNEEKLYLFDSRLENGHVTIAQSELTAYKTGHPPALDRGSYQGAYQATHPDPAEPHVDLIRELASHGLDRLGHHGPMAAMGVSRENLPLWEDILFATAQLARLPQLDDTPVASAVTIGPAADKPLHLDIPLFVSDMSFGALSEEAKIALAKGAELSGTGICSGEGGMLPEEQAENSRYFFELASGRFGYGEQKVAQCQAFHFKCGQGAKTGTGGHLPGHKVTKRIAEVRGIPVGTDAISPARFPEWQQLDDFRRFADEVRAFTDGIPIGVKMSAQNIEADLDAALAISVDYIILDGRGGGTGAAPTFLRDHISVPTIPALARARKHLDHRGAKHVSLIITGGLRTPADYAKALALGADAIALSNAALQAIGCIGMRACNTNNCPVGIATQKPHLRDRLPVDEAAERLHRFFSSSVELMAMIARACGHQSLTEFNHGDLFTTSHDMHRLAGVAFAGVNP
jgi:glutamate synthase domain-containing protein 2/nitrite reductase/ring-hydroxylating ferredoxin subunit